MKKLIMMSLMAMTILSLAACSAEKKGSTKTVEVKKVDIGTITTADADVLGSGTTTTATVPTLDFDSTAGTLTATVTMTAATTADTTIAKATIATAIAKAFNDKIDATPAIQGKVVVTATAGTATDIGNGNTVIITVTFKGEAGYTIEDGNQVKTITVQAAATDQII